MGDARRGAWRARSGAFELDAHAQVTEAARFEATRRTGLDDAAVARTRCIDGAREAPPDRNVERAAPRAAVAHEAPTRRTPVELGVARQEHLAHTRVVLLE